MQPVCSLSEVIYLSCVVLDVMQMEVIRTYTAKQPDELSLQVADVVLVSQTVDDGMLALSASLAFIGSILFSSSFCCCTHLL